MPTITFPARYLKAVRQLSAKNDARQYLNGVGIRDGYIAGTNGHALAVIELGEDIEQQELPQLVIPTEPIDYLLKKARNLVDSLPVEITWDAESPRSQAWGEMKIGQAVEHFQLVDGVFPDVLRALAKHSNVVPHSAFNWQLMIAFEKAAKALGLSKNFACKAELEPNGINAARVSIPCYPEFKGAIMPVRSAK